MALQFNGSFGAPPDPIQAAQFAQQNAGQSFDRAMNALVQQRQMSQQDLANHYQRLNFIAQYGVDPMEGMGSNPPQPASQMGQMPQDWQIRQAPMPQAPVTGPQGPYASGYRLPQGPQSVPSPYGGQQGGFWQPAQPQQQPADLFEHFQNTVGQGGGVADQLKGFAQARMNMMGAELGFKGAAASKDLADARLANAKAKMLGGFGGQIGQPTVATNPQTGMKFLQNVDENGIPKYSRLEEPDKDWEAINKEINPTVASSRTQLGTAGMMNSRAQSALKLLSGKNVSPQRIASAVTDLAGMMQRGTPEEQQLKSQMYPTLSEDLARLKQKVTGEPQSAGTPEVVAEVKRIVSELAGINNDIIRQNLDSAETTYQSTIAANRQRWKKMRSGIEKGLVNIEAEPKQQPTGANIPAGAQTATNKATGERMYFNGFAWVPVR